MKTMFKNFLLIALLAISTLSFSQRVLTNEERESLKNHGEFIAQAEWSVRNYAEYAASLDGSSANTEPLRIKWAKDRILSVNIILGGINDAQLSTRYLNLSKGMEFNLGAAPQPAETIIAAFISGNKFEEIAPAYFTLLGDGINFSVGN